MTSDDTDIPTLTHPLLPGDYLRNAGLWLEARPVRTRRGDDLASGPRTRALEPGDRERVQRMLPEVRERALDAAREALDDVLRRSGGSAR